MLCEPGVFIRDPAHFIRRFAFASWTWDKGRIRWRRIERAEPRLTCKRLETMLSFGGRVQCSECVDINDFVDEFKWEAPELLLRAENGCDKLGKL